jgi:hypothetical protein
MHRGRGTRCVEVDALGRRVEQQLETEFGTPSGATDGKSPVTGPARRPPLAATYGRLYAPVPPNGRLVSASVQPAPAYNGCTAAAGPVFCATPSVDGVLVTGIRARTRPKYGCMSFQRH